MVALRIFQINNLDLEHAVLAMNSLAVDEELQPLRIQKTLTVSGNCLHLSAIIYWHHNHSLSL
jgi:hypothetical protein